MSVVYECVYIKFGYDSVSLEPAKWLMCFNFDSKATLPRVYSYEAMDTALGQSIIDVGASEFPNSLNIRLPIRASHRDAAIEAIKGMFPGATKVNIFQPEAQTPQMMRVHNAHAKKLVAIAPVEIAA